MEPGVYAIALHQGASWRKTFTFATANPDPTLDPIPVNLTGCEVRMDIRSRAGAPDPALISLSELPTPDGSLTLGGAAGTLVIHLTAAATNRLRIKKAAYDIFLEWSNGDVDKVVMGSVTIDPAVTEPTYD